MARRKDEIKPLLATKFDFVASLDALVQRAIMLDQALGMVMTMGKTNDAGALVIPKACADRLREEMEAFKAAVFQREA